MAWRKTPYFNDREIYREFDYHRDEMKKYEGQLDRLQRANEYLNDRDFRDGHFDEKTDEWVDTEGQFTGSPYGWFKGKK
jgi:hypothetical protein